MLQRLRWHTDLPCESREVGSADQRAAGGDELRVGRDQLGAAGGLPNRVVEDRGDGQWVIKPCNRIRVGNATKSLINETTSAAIN